MEEKVDQKQHFFFRPTPCGFRQVVQQLSKPVANDINYLIRAGANAVVAAKVNWKRTDTYSSRFQPQLLLVKSTST